MQPQSLRDIIGQPIVEHLQRYAANPHPNCFLLSGPPGTGKSATARALAADLGCPDEFSGFLTISSADLTADNIREYFGHKLRLRPLTGSGWKCLLIEELDGVTSSQAERLLKIALDKNNLPAKTTIIATSNNVLGIPLALRNRFRHAEFSNGPEFRKACLEHLAQRWQKDAPGEPLPRTFWHFGQCGDGFSMRSACDEYAQCLEMLQSSFTRGQQ
jgi:DNA polymerase III delta prime subunit